MNRHRAVLIIISLLITFIVLRIWLNIYPDSDLNVGQYNIHHLFTGILIITICGIPLSLFHSNNKILNLASVGFGIGLALSLDEWVYLIATDGTNESYLLPVSLIGAAIMIGMAILYILILFYYGR